MHSRSRCLSEWLAQNFGWIYVHPLSGANEVSEENILNTKQYIVKDQPDNQKSEMHQTLINSLCQIHSVQYLWQVLHLQNL